MPYAEQPVTAHPALRRAIDTWSAPAAGILYFAGVWLFYPHDAFSLNPDEGINSMKALLVGRGYRLYDQIWSDQPPLFTHILRWWFDLFGADVVYGRRLVLLFASVLVSAVYGLVRRSWNHAAALAAVLLLVASTYFVPLSVSLMIGLPSLACAMLSLSAIVRWRRTGWTGWLGVSAVLMSFSVAIKLFTFFLVPVFASWLLFVSWIDGRRGWARPALAWLLAFAVPAAILFLALVGPAGVEQLIGPHQAARAAAIFSARGGFFVLERIVPLDLPLVVLAASGVLLIVQRRCWDLLIPPLWAAAALVVLLLHAPVWHHHYLLLSIAAAPIAGVAVAELFRPTARLGRDGSTRGARALRLTAACALLLLAFTLPISSRVSKPMVPVSWEQAQPTLDAMRHFQSRTKFVLTDDPMYAFRAGLVTVPSLAVVSMKRKESGYLTSEDVLDALERYAPEQVLLTSLFSAASADAVTKAMAGRYGLVFSRQSQIPIRLYVRNDIAELATRNGSGSSGS